MDALQRSHGIVSLVELLDPPATARRPLAAITFDDAYHGCLTIALPELARRGLPATVFVTPGLLGSAGCWWDLLAARETGSIPPTDREHILGALAGDGDAARDWARSRGVNLPTMPASHWIGSEEEIHLAAGLPGITFGPHSWSHRNLAALHPAELAAELQRPLKWLRERLTNVVPWLAYPYGLHTDGMAAEARRTGHQGVLRIGGGWVSGADLLARDLPRLNIPASISTDRFILKTRGIIPH
jgi:peptidoglycan/xylan/chitin deacetylase (PgdA/CDA1 family)